jgi:hypothetical protein
MLAFTRRLDVTVISVDIEEETIPPLIIEYLEKYRNRFLIVQRHYKEFSK